MTEAEHWIYEVRTKRIAQLNTAMLLAECGVRVLRAFANKVWFTASPEPENTACKGCVFDGERYCVCVEAEKAALDAGLPNCDDGFIYVRDPSDGRQQDLLIGGEA